jgi:hypothetical protein
MKRYLVGALVGGASLFLLGFAIYVLLIPDPKFAHGPAAAAADRPAPYLPPIIVAEVLFGALLTRALTKSGAIASVGSSIKTGAMVGATIALAYSLLILGTTHVITLNGAIYEAVTWAVRWGIAGAILAKVVGPEKKDTP